MYYKDAPVSTSARLSGNGYIELDAELFPHGKQEQQEETIMLTIRTDQSDGLILWHGQEAHTPGHSMDYIMLALEDGHLIYRYNCCKSLNQLKIRIIYIYIDLTTLTKFLT